MQKKNMRTLLVISIVAFSLISFNSEAQLQNDIARFRFELDFMKLENLRKYNSDGKVVAFVTSDGSYLISASTRFINKWNLKTGEYKQIKLNKKFAAAEEIKYAPDGLHLAYAAVNHIYIINTITGKTEHTINWKYDRTVNREYFFSPNGKWCAIDGHDELFIVNLQNYSIERMSSWSDVAYITNQFVYFSDWHERKIYYYTLANPEYYDKIKASTDATFGFDVNAAGEHGTLWFFKTKGYIHTQRNVYKKPAGGKKETINEDVGKLKKLSLQDIQKLSDLIPMSPKNSHLYCYIDKNTGLIYESDHKITNTNYFVSQYNNKYYIKVHNLQNPSQDIYLFQHETGKWLITKGNHFECSLSWLSHEKITPLIMDYYRPGLITPNTHPNNNLFSIANEPKLNVFKQFIVDNEDKTALKKWFMPNLNDSAYTQNMTDFLLQYCKPVHFQNQQWYGDSEKLLRIEDNKIYFALIENKSGDTYNGIYGIEDSLLVKGKIQQGELIEGKRFYKVSAEPGSEGAIEYAVYNGEYQNWKWHGNGVFTWGNGEKYVGEFADGHFHGHGKYLDIKGNVVYEGEFERGKKVEKQTGSQKQKAKRKPSGSHISEDRENNKANNIIGTWVISRADCPGNSWSERRTFYEDGTGKVELWECDMRCPTGDHVLWHTIEWEVEEDVLHLFNTGPGHWCGYKTPSSDAEDYLTFSCDGETLTLKTKIGTRIFTRE